jgi:hypothetical protein
LSAHWIRGWQQRSGEGDNPASGPAAEPASSGADAEISAAPARDAPPGLAVPPKDQEAASAGSGQVTVASAQPLEPTATTASEPVRDSAAATPIGQPDKPTIEAHIDGIDPRGNITGWGWAPWRPQQRLDVNAYVGEEVVSFGTANLPRTDVKEAGHGDGNYGFSLPISGSLLDGRPRPFSIRFEAPGTEPLSIVAELRSPFRSGRRSSLDPLAETPDPAAAPLAIAADKSGTPAIYVPGQYVICTTPYPRPPYHAEGWYEPEEEFTWIRGSEAVIEMLLRRPLGSYTFALEVVPNGIGGRLQTLEIFLNYFRVGFFEVAKPATVSVELPAEIFILRKTRINLHCRNAVTPSEHGIADDRRLGIAVSGWCIA